MKLPQKGRRIVWLLRLLTVIGLAIVVTAIGLVGLTLSRVRNVRARVAAGQGRLDQASQALRERAAQARNEIYFMLDETAARPVGASAVAGLNASIRAQLDSKPDPAVLPSLEQLRERVSLVATLSRNAEDWRAGYSVVWDDLSRQKTAGRVRDLISGARAAVESLEGRRRLDGAIQFRRWRNAVGADSSRLASEILLQQAGRQSRDSTDFKNQLAEIARLVELLGGEEKFDSLTDLKDNKLKPVLDRMGRSIAAFGAEQSGQEALSSRTIEDLKTAIFGEGYISDDAHQNVQPGRGGLFTLRRDALSLRRDREKLKVELAAAFQTVEDANAMFAQSAQVRTAARAREVEQSLASGWRQMLFFGGSCSGLFLWLAWLISRGIQGQVNALELARAEAETGRQTTQKLMLEQQAAARQLAAAHQGLQTSELRFRMLSSSAPIGIFETDATGAGLYTNPYWQNLAGLSQAESLGDGWKQAVHPDDAPAVFGSWKSTASEGREFDHEFRFCTPAGEVRWVHARSTAIRSEAGEVSGHVGTVEDITERKRAEAELAKAHRELLEVSRQAGMAEVATGVLHNVGNVLNSVNVSATLVAEKLKKSKAVNLGKVAALLRDHESDLGAFLTSDAKGKQVPAFLGTLAQAISAEQAELLKEMAGLQKNIEHIKDVVAMQQSYTKVSAVTETVTVTELIEDALRMNVSSLMRHDIEVVREFADLPAIEVDKHKALQILVNLIRNAKHACDDAGRTDKRITLRTWRENGSVRITVVDNGVGIPPENLNRIFNHGFTTRKDGHGFGLHSGANAAREMSGNLTVHSEGPGHGAAFTLEFPINLAGQTGTSAAGLAQMAA